MEQFGKLQKIVGDYGANLAAIKKATDLTQLDELKLKGVKLLTELSRQVNRVAPEFSNLTRELRSELTNANYQAILAPKKIEVKQTQNTKGVKAKKTKIKKAKK